MQPGRYLRCVHDLCSLEDVSGALCVLQLRDEIMKYKVGAPARVGLVAPNDVMVPGGNTGLDPSQTSFFQVRSSISSCSPCLKQPDSFSSHGPVGGLSELPRSRSAATAAAWSLWMLRHPLLSILRSVWMLTMHAVGQGS